MAFALAARHRHPAGAHHLLDPEMRQQIDQRVHAVFTADEFTSAGREAIRSELAEKPRGPGKHLPFPALIELDSPTTAHAWSDDLRVKILRVKIEREGDPASWVITSLGRYDDARAGSRHTLKAREGVRARPSNQPRPTSVARARRRQLV